MREVPLYLTCGMLESGKTRFIRGILEDYEFTERKKSLLLRCEQGEEEYDEKLLREANCVLVDIENEEDLTPAKILSLIREHRPYMIFVEFNGMWQVEPFLENLPEQTPLVQMFTLIDAGTYELYMNNMRGFLMNCVKHSDVVIVNRCTGDTKKASIRRTMRGANPRIQVMYEKADGVSDDEVEDDLPFDLTKDVVGIEEEDFGIWYLDVMENPAKYAGKKVSFLAQTYRDEMMPRDNLYAGRYAMTCCEADIQFVGVMVRWKGAAKLQNMGFVRITGKVFIEANEMYTAPGPVVTAESILPAGKPKDRLVYFN